MKTVFGNVPNKQGKIYCHKRKAIVTASFEDLGCYKCKYLNGCDSEGNIECEYDAGSENTYQTIFNPEKQKAFVEGD